ncbi:MULTISPECIES: glycosyltransferase family 2 protein [unclassified Streptomyces]|uniref:glycosyltransferase family 2 protein n=1 Tax=Streptomycetaceae TaxID=2062 RepID=UPI002E792205|nr:MULTISPECIES: glycosyltransferase family 2 protein [unclassified Streptomyces]MED7951748.1 glycosyltransferase family 2 protein [Streptomyces sp. BE303]MEE1828918.1 glycosyltransferase family 2 protein [Streptomyces sp. BE20]
MPTAPQLSVVMPIYNEQEALPLTVERLRPILDALDVTYEVVGVDDGSTDVTPVLMQKIRQDWPEFRIVRFARNSGHQAALTAGIHRALGDYVVSIDADLQDPPEKIPEMLALAREQNLDIVYGVRGDRATDTRFKRRTAGAYYWLMRKLVGKRMPSQAGDYRLLSRAAVDALKSLPEHQPVYRLLVPWLGFPSGEVVYVREERVAGATHYPLSKMVRLAIDSITNFSASPLRLATWMGLLSFLVCIGLAVYTAFAYALGATVPGWSSLFIGMLFIGAVQLICVGLLGEYIGRIYSAVQARPAYFVGYDSAEDEWQERSR